MNRARLALLLRKLPGTVRSFARRFHESGHECYLVGGAVRNLILGNRPTDFDFATDASPQQVMRLFRRVIPTGVEHGTVTVIQGRQTFEVTTYRTEEGYSDTRRPDSVEFIGDVYEDLKRRDFTMNAMALDPVRRSFLDPHEGERDIGDGIIRAIGDPGQRFGEDALRMLRAVRFATELEFDVDSQTLEAIRACAPLIAAVSMERVRDEITKMLQSRRPSVGLRMMQDTGLLPLALPEVAEGVGVEQRGNHRYDVFEHSIRACDAAPREDLAVRLAALLHDVGKPRAMVDDPSGERRFHRHEQISAQMSEEILRRLKYPNRTIAEVIHLVRHHMFNYTPEWTDAAVRRFVARVGADSIPSLVALRAADSEAIAGRPVDSRALGEFVSRVEGRLAAEEATSVRDLAVGGRDLIDAGIPPGPGMGAVLEALLEAVLDDPSLNTKPQLLDIARRYYRERVRGP